MHRSIVLSYHRSDHTADTQISSALSGMEPVVMALVFLLCNWSLILKDSNVLAFNLISYFLFSLHLK